MWHAAGVRQGPSSTPDRRKKWVWTWAREAPEIRGFPFNVSVTVKASDLKFGIQLEFAKAHHKITPGGKRRRRLGQGELPNILGFSIIFMQRLGLATSNLAQGPS